MHASNTITVSDLEELNQAIETANEIGATGGCIIRLQCENDVLKLSDSIRRINTAGKVKIESHNASAGIYTTIDGKKLHRGFVIVSGSIEFVNIKFMNMHTEGAEGCMGAGSCIFVANNLGTVYAPKSGEPTTVKIRNTYFESSKAKGGAPGDQAIGGTSGQGAEWGNRGDDANIGNEGNFPATANRGILLGGELQAGYFGVCGGPGYGGYRGAGGHPMQGTGNGQSGSTGFSGQAAGYGGGGGASGSGGGGGGGAGGIDGGGSGGNGGNGGDGGKGGKHGFGGGKSGGQEPGQAGLAGEPIGTNSARGGNGGNGGNGSYAGGGAGFGGAVFIMGGASVTFSGHLKISGNSATGGVSPWKNGAGSAAGSGIFLHGSGNLNFHPGGGDETFAITDEISDEVGADENASADLSFSATGPDGLSTSGGGVWGLSVSGETMILAGKQSFAGPIEISEGGTLKLGTTGSNYRNHNANDLMIGSNATLEFLPDNKEHKLHLTTLAAKSGSSRLVLNGFSRIHAEHVKISDGCKIHIKSGSGASFKEAIAVLKSTKKISNISSVTVSEGYSVSLSKDGCSILIKKDSSK